MTLCEVIKEVEKVHPDYKKINIYYYADIYDLTSNECLYPDEFVGVASYHDNYLDTTEDPDGWSLEDKVKEWHEYDPVPEDIYKGIYSIHVNLGEF